MNPISRPGTDPAPRPQPRLIPVLDLKGGRPVRAVGGNRAHYGPLRSILHPDGANPVELARACRDRLGLHELYVADLDAILGAAPRLDLCRAIADLGMHLWLDAGVRDRSDVGPLMSAGVGTVVLGLETLGGPEPLSVISREFDRDRLAFSLDLREGRPLVPTSTAWGSDDPRRLADVALQGGIRRLIVLDLARVGMGQGLGTLPLLSAIRADHPAIDLVAGGGVSGVGDLRDLGAAGASGVLVGSALHDGRIGGV